MSWMTTHLLALLIGFILDFIFGDPHWLPHPIRAIGKLISVLEVTLRRAFPKTEKGKLAGGVVLVILASAIPTALTFLLQWLSSLISSFLALILEAAVCYQMLAARSLRDESMKVYKALKIRTIDDARDAVSMIVGRDTDSLDEAGVVKAAVETVAENACDGVIAPLIFMALGGAPVGVFYKACNTMDSMVGYKNDRYLFFGRAAALWDDVLSFIPARLSGLILCLAAFVSGFDGKDALRVFRRDRKKHKSPNSAHTEAACAGALGVRLAGSGYYFGTLVDKPTIGDPCREIEPEDILRANRLMYAAAILSVIVFCIIPLILSILIQEHIA